MRLNTKLTESKKQKGITLIALVVTIVVLLILAGVSVNALFGSNGIIEKAKEAQNKMDEAKENDLEGINELTNWIGNQVNGTTDDNKSNTLKSYEDASKENAVYTDNENAKVTIPKGFKVSDVAATANSDGEQTVSKGLVIQDKDGNEFVWIPVEYTATGTLDENGLDNGFKNVFNTNRNNNSRYEEPYTKGYGENGEKEKSDYVNMMKSVQENKGFYIGRYEAGSVDENGNNVARTATTTTTNKVVVKRDAYPYIYVGWGNAINDITTDVTDSSNKLRGKGAVYLCENMYASNEIGATSTLCYGVQWDATMNFVNDSTHSTSNSTSWGNYGDSIILIDRGTAYYSEEDSVNWKKVGTSGKTKDEEEYILLTTGASDNFKAKNIFDLAGNVGEWTMETFNDTYRCTRGGSYYQTGSRFSAFKMNIGTTPIDTGITLGFRPTLYL